MDFKLFFSQKTKEIEKPNPSKDVFGEYDIRGIYPDQINKNFFCDLARAIVDSFKPKKVVLGRDSRLSSPLLTQALGDTFIREGVDVIDAGLIITPMAGWIARRERLEVLMVTASHNPPNYNGLKIYSRKGRAVSKGSGLEKIEKNLLEKEKKRSEDKKEPGILKRKDFIKEYQEYLLSLAGRIKNKNLRLALDYSNGTTGLVLGRILEKLKINFTTLNEEPNGRFPGHNPNPLKPETHQKISWLLKNGRYSAGAIFDGDGDRIVFFNEKGEEVRSAQVFSLLCEYFIPQARRFRSVVVTTSFSRVIREVVKEAGGQVYISPVGRTNVSPMMRRKRSLMGAERSGHYFFKDFNYEDSAGLALLRVLEILSQSEKSFSQLTAPFEKHVTLPEINIPFKDKEDGVLAVVKDAFPGGRVSKIDGLAVIYKDWWFNLRRSRTENVWRLNLEGERRDTLEMARVKIEEIIERASLLDKE